MKILAIEKEIAGATPEQFRPLLKAEAQRVWQLQQSGMIREIWFTVQGHNAVITLECANADEAAQALQSLPLVQANLITFDILPLQPYDGFARLFADTK
jgi:muconolactone delta-isomerase